MAPTAEPRRIALIASSFAPHIGGVEEHVARVAEGLAARGHTVEVWTVDRGLRPEHPFSVPVRYLPTPLPARSLAALARFAWRAPAAWLKWTRAYRRLRPDVLHVQCFGPNGVYARALRRRYGTPLVVTSHGETLGDDNSIFARSKLLRDGLRSALADAAAVTAPSRYVLDDLRDRFGAAAGVVVPNGVALDVDPVDPGFPAPYLLAYGRLGHMKGFDLLLDAYVRAGLEVPLVIAGDGPEHAALVSQASGLLVSFPGRWDASQVAGAVTGALAVVVPSRSEAFGIVALEAWRGGAPLVMTSRGGASEFMTNGEDALLVDPTDVSALADALRRVVSDAALRARLSAAGRTRVGEFTWDAVVSQYEAVYTS